MPVIVRGKPRVAAELSDGDILWRYVDAAKFMDLIHGRRLFFTRGDQFADKFEGAFTQSLKHAIERSYQDNKIPFSFPEFKRRLRERVFVNCWCVGPDDSIAMWQLYGRSPCAVAITTTVKKLRDSLRSAHLPYNIAISKVQYVKHWRDPSLNIKPYSNVFSYKVKAYDFEREVRVIVDRFADDFDETAVNLGMSVVIDPRKLLRSVVVGPEAPEWFLDLVADLSRKYRLTAPVRRSKLTFDPV
jgi:hypothetical protein